MIVICHLWRGMTTSLRFRLVQKYAFCRVNNSLFNHKSIWFTALNLYVIWIWWTRYNLCIVIIILFKWNYTISYFTAGWWHLFEYQLWLQPPIRKVPYVTVMGWCKFQRVSLAPWKRCVTSFIWIYYKCNHSEANCLLMRGYCGWILWCCKYILCNGHSERKAYTRQH